MTRRQRLDSIGGVHHVMNRGVNHAAVFLADPDRVEFGQRLADIHDRFAVETLAYCLMDNHYHLLVRTTEGRISEAMQRLGSLYTRHTNDRLGRDGPLFRGRFHSIAVTTDSYLLCAARYIHRNALDLPGVASASTYRWSSYRSYLGFRRSPPFLNAEPVLSLYGDDRRRMMESTEDAEHWIDPRDTVLVGPPTAATLAHLVELAIANDDLAYGNDDVATQGLVRTMLVLLSREPVATSWSTHIDTLLSMPSATAYRSAVARARRRLASDPAVRRILSGLIDELRPLRNAA